MIALSAKQQNIVLRLTLATCWRGVCCPSRQPSKQARDGAVLLYLAMAKRRPGNDLRALCRFSQIRSQPLSSPATMLHCFANLCLLCTAASVHSRGARSIFRKNARAPRGALQGRPPRQLKRRASAVFVTATSAGVGWGLEGGLPWRLPLSPRFLLSWPRSHTPLVHKTAPKTAFLFTSNPRNGISLTISVLASW